MLHAARSLARTPDLPHARHESLRGATHARTLQAMDAEGYQPSKQDKKKAKQKEKDAEKQLVQEQLAYEAQLASIEFSVNFLNNHTANSEQAAQDRTLHRGGNWDHQNTVIDLSRTSLRNLREQIHQQCSDYPNGAYNLPVNAARWLFNAARNNNSAVITEIMYSDNAQVHLKSFVSWQPFKVRVTGIAQEAD